MIIGPGSEGIDLKILPQIVLILAGKVVVLAGSMLNSLGNVLTNGFLILMTVIFMLFKVKGRNLAQ
jgi:hypothetical protein